MEKDKDVLSFKPQINKKSENIAKNQRKNIKIEDRLLKCGDELK